MSDLMFGYTWQEIKAAQQGKPLVRNLPPCNGDISDVCLPGDVDLLVRYGLKELETRGYHGVIDRLARAGIIGDNGGDICKTN